MTKIKIFYSFLILSLLVANIIGCSKKRPATLSETQQETYFSINDLKSASLTITLDNPKVDAIETKEIAIAEAKPETLKFKVVKVDNGDERLHAMFDDLSIEGTSGAVYKIKFTVTPKFITAYKIVSDEEKKKLSKNEKGLVKQVSKENLVPLFSYAVESYGILRVQKNDNGEDTKNFELKSSTFSSATHITITPRPDNRDIAGLTDSQKETIFDINDLKDMIITLKLSNKKQDISEEELALLGKENINDKYEVTHASNGDNFLYRMFSGLGIEGTPNSKIQIRFTVDKQHVTAYKVIPEDELKNLARYESSTVKKIYNQNLVPLFAVPVSAYGNLIQQKNDNGEELNAYELKASKFASATHVNISPMPDNRITLGLNEEQRDKYYSINDLNKMELSVELSDKACNFDSSEEAMYEAAYEIPKYKIASVTGGDKNLYKMFLDYCIEGKSNSKINVQLKVNKKAVTVFKVVQENELAAISKHESAIATKFNKNDNNYYIPIFAFNVESYGYLKNKKNDNNEEEKSYELKSVEFEKSTHIAFSPFPKNRIGVGIDSIPKQERERVFVTDKFNKKVYDGITLAAALNIKIDLENESKYFVETTTGISADKRIYISKLLSKNDMLPGHLKIFEKETDHFKIRECPSKEIKDENVLKEFSKLENCMMVAIYSLGVDYIQPKANISNDGTTTWDISYENSEQKTSIIKISKQVPVPIEIADDSASSSEMLSVAKLKNKEFLFRRQLIDSPNSFEYGYAGAAGDLQIVKFEFTDNYLNIKRSGPLTKLNGTTAVDEEILLSFPVSYYKKVNKNSQGELLPKPNYFSSNYSDPEALAVLNWNNNIIPTLHSPLEYLNLEQCFAGKSQTILDGFDFNLSEGKMAFTITSTYPINPNMGCAEWNNGYFATNQMTYTFKERVSFKEYHPIKDEMTPLMSIPFNVQKKLKFGYFTYDRVTPNTYGETNKESTVVPLMTLFDIREKGSMIPYTLAGIPSEKDDHKLRKIVIESTIKVVKNINIGLRRSFIGTPLERTSDYVQLYIEGLSESEAKTYKGQGVEATATKTMGDLDKNYIYYIQKGSTSGLLGLGGNHHNPRNGKIESASVYIYGGNLWNSINYLRNIEKFKEEYKKNMTVTNADNAKHSNTKNNESVANFFNSKEIKKFAESIKDEVTKKELLYFAYELEKINNSNGKGREIANTSQNAITRSPATLRATTFKRPDMSKIVYSLLAKKSFWKKMASEKLSSKNIDEKRIIEQLSTLDPESKKMLLNFVELKKEKKLPTPERVAMLLDNKWSKRYSINEKIKAKYEEKGIDMHFFNPLDFLSHTDKRYSSSSNNYEIFQDEYEGTLAHEVMHNFGLRHNFIASFDKANFYFDNEVEIVQKKIKAMVPPAEGSDPNAAPTYEEKTIEEIVPKTDRNYSSIMDYQNQNYDGLGPHDVYSLRAGYTGLIEIPSKVIAATETIQDETTKRFLERIRPHIINKKFLPISSLQTILGIKGWGEFDKVAANSLSDIVPYKFCTDEDAGMTPTCDRFDDGASAKDIVNNIIENYYTTYALRNFRNDRYSFTDYNGYYIGYLFNSFEKIKMFLDELMYQLIYENPPEDVITDLAGATINGYQFLQTIIATPDAESSDMIKTNRFTRIASDKGDTIIEKKALRDQELDDDGELKYRGIEYDKIVALLTMTQKNGAANRYNKQGLNISYFFLEKLLLNQSIEQISLFDLMKQILTDNVRPIGKTLDTPILLPLPYKSSTTETLQYYAILGGTLFIDQDTPSKFIENPTTFFRVIADRNPPADVLTVSAPNSSRNDIKLWTPENAIVSKKIFDRAHGMQTMSNIASNEKLIKTTQGWFINRYQAEMLRANGDSASEKLKKFEADRDSLAKIIDDYIKKLPETVGKTDLDELYELMKTNAVEALYFSSNPEAASRAEDYAKFKHEDNLKKIIDKPILALGTFSLPINEKNKAMISAMVPRQGELAEMSNTDISTLEEMAKIFVYTHPEFK